MKWILISVLLLLGVQRASDISVNNVRSKSAMSEYLTLNNTIRDIVNHDAFRGFGELLLPWADNTSYYNTSLRNVGSLMPYHSNVRPGIVLLSLNHMIDEVDNGKRIFYRFYSDQQRQQNPSMDQTGLFYFRGDRGAPFAIICPGGGFSYVGSLHEGFPLALEISKKGLNAFVMRYSVKGSQRPTEDLAAAISYIFKNADILGVSTKDYALWGGSAGARMVGDIALSGVSAYGGGTLPKPAAAIIAYTGHSTYSVDFPPTFITAAANDYIANINTVERRVKNLKTAGVEVEYRRYDSARHGFGTGHGTDAEGWMDHAVAFWKKQMTRP